MQKPTRTTTTIRLKTDAAKPMDVDLIAENVKSVADNFDKALKAGLTKRAIVLLIHDSIPGKTVNMGDIQTVLEYAPQIVKYLSKK